jgi:hypothetical protein
MAPAVPDDIGGDGHLDGPWPAWLDGRQASRDDRAETTISGRVADQATCPACPPRSVTGR